MADKSSSRRPISLNDSHYRFLQDLSAPPKTYATRKEEEEEEVKPSMAITSLRKAFSKQKVDEDDSVPQFSGITDFDSPPTVKEEAKVSKVKIEGKRRLCKVSYRDSNDICNNVVADEQEFSGITDFDSPLSQPKNVKESDNARGENEIRDILNDLNSRLHFLSIEKKKGHEKRDLVGCSPCLMKVDTQKMKDGLHEDAIVGFPFSLTSDPSDSSLVMPRNVEDVVENVVDEHEDDQDLWIEPESDRAKETKNNVASERKNELGICKDKMAYVRESFEYNIVDDEEQDDVDLQLKLEGVAAMHKGDKIKKIGQRPEKREPKELHERLWSVGRYTMSDVIIDEAKRCKDKFMERNRPSARDTLDDYKEDNVPHDEESIILDGQRSTYILPGKIAKMLYPHQCEGLRWLWSLHYQGKGGILGDDMGLGKTMQICGFLAGLFHSRLIKRALVVAPKTLLPHWIKELSVVGLSEKTREYFGTCTKAREYELQYVLQDKGILLTTYDIVRNNSQSLRGMKYFDDDGEDSIAWDYMILDEGHLIKNPSTQRAKSLLEIPCAHRVIISGTPIQNNLKELWALFHFCCPGLLGDKNWFKEQYEYYILRGNDKNASDREKRIGSTVAKELRERIQPYFLRRLKAEVFCEDAVAKVKLSKKNEIIVWLRLTSCQRHLYEAFLNSELVLSAFDGSPLAALTILKKICDHPLLLTKRAAEDLLDGMDSVDSMLNPEEVGLAEKLAMHIADVTGTKDFQEKHDSVSCKISFISSLLDNLIPGGHRVLIFSQTRKMLNLIQDSLASNNYKFLRIDGTTKASDRVKIVNEFQDGNGAPIFLLTSQVGGLGLTLTKADRVIVVDPAWNPSTDNQSVDRAYRIGQTKDVIVYRLMTCGTVEEKIYRKQIFKGGLFRTATEHKEQIRYFSQQDLRELFSLPKHGFDVSPTQQQLHEEHDSQHKMDEALEAHIRFLETQGIAGVSHHSLLFSKTSPVEVVQEEDIRMKRTTFVGHSSTSHQIEQNIDGAQHAFNPKDVKLHMKSPSPDDDKLTESEIKKRVHRLSQILANKITVMRLPDKGAKLQKQMVELNLELENIRKAKSTAIPVINLDDLTEDLQRVLKV